MHPLLITRLSKSEQQFVASCMKEKEAEEESCSTGELLCFSASTAHTTPVPKVMLTATWVRERDLFVGNEKEIMCKESRRSAFFVCLFFEEHSVTGVGIPGEKRITYQGFVGKQL